MSVPTITVMLADGRVSEHPITGMMIVGRAQDAGVFIDDPSVERRHARVELVEGKVFLSDLGSNTGTFVNGAEIAANFRVPLTVDTRLRFGIVDAMFRIPAAQPVGNGEPGIQPVLVKTTTPPRALIPGQTAAVTIELKNIGQIVESFRVRVLDLPETWVRIPVDQVNLLPDAASIVRVEITPPRSPEAVAGRRQMRVEVEAVSGRTVLRAVEDIEIEPFTDVRLGVRGTGTSRPVAVVRNRGNVPVHLSLSARDAATHGVLQVNPAALRVEPGEEVESLVLPSAGNAPSAFAVTAVDLEGNEIGSASGNYIPPVSAQPAPPPVPRPAPPPVQLKAKKKRRWPAVLVGLLLVGGLAAAGAFFLLANQDENGGRAGDDDDDDDRATATATRDNDDDDDDPTPTPTTVTGTARDIREMEGDWRNRNADIGDLLQLAITPQSDTVAFVDGALQDEGGIIILSTVEGEFEDGVLRVRDGFILGTSVDRLLLTAILDGDELVVEIEHCVFGQRGTSCDDPITNTLVR